ncbi:efflux transporter outer membrane subunit [soil metagenome]
MPVARTQFWRSLAVVAAAVTAGCGTPGGLRNPDGPGAQIPMPERFIEAPDVAARATFGGHAWWQTLGDRHLDRLVATALSENLGLRETGSRVVAAGATLRQANAQLFPSVDATGEVSRRWGEVGGGGGGGRDGRDGDEASLGALLDWEVDIFGRLRAARRAAARELEATRADLEGARLLLSASVAESYFGRIEQRQQLALLAEQIEVGETLLRLTRLRFGQGQAAIVDVLQQEEQLRATRALVPTVEGRVTELGYTLDALLGRPPGGAPRDGPASLPQPPPLPATCLPSDLLLHRPDLVAAQERLAALDAQVAEAVADRLPRFQLSAASLAESGGSSLATNLVASVVAPLFDAGDRRAEVTRRRAELEGAVAAFGDTFLGALRDVESALVSGRAQAERLRRQESQLETAERLLAETRIRYSQGLTEYLPVLTALTSVQQLQRDLITTRRERLSQRISLHRALGGPLP